MNLFFKNINKQKSFYILITVLIFLLSLLFYWREGFSKEGIKFSFVLLWQLLIWIPWFLFFYILNEVNTNLKKLGLNERRVYILSLLLVVGVAIHVGWFFLISINFSPYRGLSRACYGAYPYVFIFWTTIDLGISIIVYNTLTVKKKFNKENSLQFTFSNNGNKIICRSNQIIWMKSKNYETKIKTTQGEFYTRKPLKYYESILSKDVFLRIHRGTIINSSFVKVLNNKNSNLTILMEDNFEFSVSRRMLKSTKGFFKKDI